MSFFSTIELNLSRNGLSYKSLTTHIVIINLLTFLNNSTVHNIFEIRAEVCFLEEHSYFYAVTFSGNIYASLGKYQKEIKKFF